MAKGSIGTATGTIIYTKKRRGRKADRKPKRSNCKDCIHAVVNNDNVANCMITGDIAVHKYYCEFYKNRNRVERFKNSKRK